MSDEYSLDGHFKMGGSAEEYRRRMQRLHEREEELERLEACSDATQYVECDDPIKEDL